jgi:hypothetical protein
MAEPAVEREDCDICGAKPIRMIVEGRPLCEQHRAEWIGDEAYGAGGRIERVVAVLDRILDEPMSAANDDDWDAYLRRIAVAVLEAAA